MPKAVGARRAARQGRARLLAKVYEIRKILESKIPVRGHLDKIERSPPGINTTSLN